MVLGWWCRGLMKEGQVGEKRGRGWAVLKSVCRFLAASNSLSLGDEILAVNSQPLYGLSHRAVVDKLKKAGPSLVLLVRPNQTLQDIFSSSHSSSTAIHPSHMHTLPSPVAPPAALRSNSTADRAPPLPQGWGRKLDQKTGRIYFEK